MGLFKDGVKDVGSDLVDKTTDNSDVPKDDKKDSEQLNNGKDKTGKSDKDKNSSSKKDDNSDTNLKKLIGNPSQVLGQNVVDGVVGDKNEKDDDAEALKKVSKGVKKVAKTPGALGALKIGALGTFLVNGGLVGLIKAGLTALINIIKAGISAVVNGVINFIGGIISGIGGAFSGAVAAVSGALSIGTALASTIVLTGVTTVAVGAVGVIGSSIMSDPSMYDSGTDEDCYTKVAEAKEASENDSGDDAALAEANAKKLYSVFHQYGWSDNMIAGMLGNFDVEGGIDETSVEGIYDERHHIGERKKKALEDPDTYTSDVLFGEIYAGKGYDITNWLVDKNKPHDKQTNPYACVLGLAQWTGGRSNTFYNLSKQLNVEWTNLTFQMAYIIFENEGSRSCYGGVDMNGKSASECAFQFTKSYEGNTSSGVSERQSRAEYWAGKLSSWSSSELDLQTVIDMVKQMNSDADVKGITEANSKCSKKIATADNSSAAAAAVSMATDDYEASKYSGGASGTELYAKVVGYFHGGSTAIMDCGWFVCAAILYSGTDDSMPKGSTGSMIAYFEASEKWEKVCETSSSADESKLQPGDVFVNSQHTWMYVGEEAVLKKYPNKTGCVHTSASTGGLASGRSASVNTGDYGGGIFTVYRCKAPQNSETYKNIGDGASSTKLVPLSPSM